VCWLNWTKNTLNLQKLKLYRPEDMMWTAMLLTWKWNQSCYLFFFLRGAELLLILLYLENRQTQRTNKNTSCWRKRKLAPQTGRGLCHLALAGSNLWFTRNFIYGTVRRVKALLGLSPLGLISRLLRDQESSKRLEGKTFSLAGRGQSPVAGVLSAPHSPNRRSSASLAREQYPHGSVAPRVL
jgi:hypothetical protein